MSGILSNAISGLQASQNALRTAGHNISNANTQGYSRQEVNYVTRPEQIAGGAGYIGSGVTTASIERVVNEFVTTQLRSDTSTYNQLNKYSLNISKVDKLFAEASTGLSGSLQSFFAALQNGANDPASTPARQLIITEAQSLSSRFNNLYQRMADIEKSVNGEVRTVTSQINSLATSIAELNQSIGEAVASGGGNQPNDLLDKRDETLRQLAELVSIQVVKESTGDLNVFIGNGQPLVLGASSSSFSVTNDGQIQLRANSAVIDITEQVSGGQIGGLLSFRDEVLSPSMNELGRIAISMSEEFNNLQQQGLDLDNDYGQKMFVDINDPVNAVNRVKHSSGNQQPYDRQLNVTITDTNQLTASDYRFDIVPGTTNYVVTRLADDQVVKQGGLSGAYPFSIEFDGVSLNLTSGSFQGGDSFLVQPTRNGSQDIKALLQRPEDLAFASPIRTGSASSNTGSGIVSSGQVLSVVDTNGNILPAFANPGQLSPPIIIRFTSDTTYDVLDNSDPANPKHLNPAMQDQVFVPGTTNNIFSSDPGETRIVGAGDRLGLPADRSPQTVAIGAPAQGNGYLAERLNFTFTDPQTGSVTARSIITQSGASAMQTAAQLSALPGVTANAYTTATITGINVAPGDFAVPMQLRINGEAIIQDDGALPTPAFLSTVPDPNLSEADFNDYLAEQINANPNLNALGIRAQSSTNPLTGAPELRLFAASGVDLDIRFSAASATSSIQVNDSSGNPNQTLTSAGVGQESAITVGGRIDVTLASGIEMSPSISSSPLFGDSSSATFVQSSFLGYQVTLTGQPKAGDVFTVGFNTDGKNDNRNALAMVAMETKSTMQNGSLSFAEGYGKLVEEVGTKSSLAKINTEASISLLEQSQTMRDSISGVNLDEEAADLIRFQQLYGANAQVISVARELFDTLLNAL
ncbi:MULTISPECIES: flagellar hook-associated protein FlgK [unclassified Cellvibrio]|jgi:flagellar hook-associated protein 1 FlgK|uniref:flagellar hook-associated protein FlgK n=1 Tax=unclassified Cellvibrio TaxID=2624793 RepID=UPI001244E367|nr:MULTISPECIES: flagellar hook-associated protein FlgK [unclassified Cellvibrio]QEY13091.1 flagellar hook-associated protein FlgK [Cellvibrio sp. KY-YJ-3]UUA73647.1 flagellar hook-associated protein FlgK [Cellvibrio sp. QJXJ]